MSVEPPSDELAYIKYSAKEILFHLTSKVEALQADVKRIELNMVSRYELQQARRWAIGAGLASVGTLIAAIGLFA
jgi:hypothetical protein